jgi:hypothetical protein
MNNGRFRHILVAVVAILVVALGPASAAAHPGPQGSNWSRCKGWVGQGDRQFTGTIYGVTPNTWQQFYVKIVASPSAGWTGRWSINGSDYHDSTAIPAGLYHWMPSPAIAVGPAANIWFSPSAKYLFAPFSTCGGGTGCDGGGGYRTVNYSYRVDVDAFIGVDTDYGVDIFTTGYRCD